MAKAIIDSIAKYVKIPEDGTGLDVGCSSCALTIACAKWNPHATMVGCDIWSSAYKAVFTQKLCKDNAKAEGVRNVRFQEGNAIHLPIADESFDTVNNLFVKGKNHNSFFEVVSRKTSHNDWIHVHKELIIKTHTSKSAERNAYPIL